MSIRTFTLVGVLFAAVCAALISVSAASPTVEFYSSKAFDGYDVPSNARNKVEHPTRINAPVALRRGLVLQLVVTVDAAEASPRQVFLHLAHRSLGEEGILVLKKTSTPGKYSLSVSVESEQFTNFVKQPGLYDARLYIAGPSFEPIDWNIASVNVDIPTSPREPSKLAALPEITPIFREADARAPDGIALAATGICLSPFLLLIVMWFRIGFNFGNFPSDGSTLLSTLLFQGSLAATLLLLGRYWVGLSIFQAIQGLAILGAIMTITGIRAFLPASEQAPPLKTKKGILIFHPNNSLRPSR